MLTTEIIINYLFPMNNSVVKASESYEKSYKFAWEVLWISFCVKMKCYQEKERAIERA